ncbi:DNA-3-methyladenine glycosylase family protein [Nonomuraea sp. NPDC052265]|uniref:DNA-3-methyladenine glycosylase family protein n=1 Tax=Nonomuraea sp. NPDC052265 TaxID=3364374 RepID=UPI0037C856FE
MTTHGFTLTAEGPFDFGSALRFVEDWPATSALPSDGRTLRFAYCAESDWLPIGVSVTAAPGGVAVTTTRAPGPAIRGEVARIFSLDVDATGFAALGEADPVLGDVQRDRPGLRPVCFWSPWEAACWAVIVQRSSMLVASRIKQRIADRYGATVTVDGQAYQAFPPPVSLVDAGGLGLPVQKEEWLRGLARAALDGVLTTKHLRSLAPEDALAELRAARRGAVLGRSDPDPRGGRARRVPRRRAPAVRHPARGVRAARGRPGGRLPQDRRVVAALPLVGLVPVPRHRLPGSPRLSPRVRRSLEWSP